MDAQFEKRKNLICELVADESYVPMKEKELAAVWGAEMAWLRLIEEDGGKMGYEGI